MKLLETLKARNLFALLFLTLFVIVSPATAQDTTDNQNRNQDSEFSSWDGNGDSALDQDEFNSGVSDMGYYDDWDVDRNGEVSETEWDTGVAENFNNYGSEAYGEYSDWDSDNDGMLSEDEFGNGLFDTVDENDDDSLTEDEFNSWFDDGLF